MRNLSTTWREWRNRRSVLRDLKRSRCADNVRAAFIAKDELDVALSAVKFGNPESAIRTWDRLLAAYPEETRKSPKALVLLMQLRRFDEAEQMIKILSRTQRSDPHLTVGLADIAKARRNHEQAVELYAEVRRRAPGVAGAYTSAVASLCALGRQDEAETLANQAIKKFPMEFTSYLEHARIATRRREWNVALGRWQMVRDKFPNQLVGLLGYVEALGGLGRQDEAKAELTAGRTRFPSDQNLLIELARLAEMSGDRSEATELWTRIARSAPLDLNQILKSAAALEKLGAIAEVEAILRAAAERFETEERPKADLAKFLKRHDPLAGR